MTYGQRDGMRVQGVMHVMGRTGNNGIYLTISSDEARILSRYMTPMMVDLNTARPRQRSVYITPASGSAEKQFQPRMDRSDCSIMATSAVIYELKPRRQYCTNPSC